MKASSPTPAPPTPDERALSLSRAPSASAADTIQTDNCVPAIAENADRLVELFEAEAQRLHAIYEARLRETEARLRAQADAELTELRRTVQQQRALLAQTGTLPPSPVGNADTTDDAGDAPVKTQSTSTSSADDVSRIKRAIEAVDFVYMNDGSIRFTPRSAHCTEFIVGLFSSAVAHCRQSGIQSAHLTRSEALIAGPIKPTDFWEVLELMALLPGLHEAAAAEDARAGAAAAMAGAPFKLES